MNKLLFTISNYKVKSLQECRGCGGGGGGGELKEISQRSERNGATLLIQSRFEL